MEPNKLENKFREKLDERQIVPSAPAWDRLNAMLTIAEEKKSKLNNGWLYVAASIIGFLFIGIVFFSQTEALIDVRKNEIVTTEKEIIQTQKQDVDTNKNEIVPPIQSTALVVKVLEKDDKVTPNSTIVENQDLQIAQNTTAIKNEDTITEKQESFLTMGNNSIAIQTNEVEKPSIKVDARNLLSQVDGELELSFREKVIKTVNKNYKTVKVALANRNQE